MLPARERKPVLPAQRSEITPVSDLSILGQVALCYSPFIDRNRVVTATRLTVFPLWPEATLDVSQLLEAVAQVWPAEGGKVSLNVVSEGLLGDLLRAPASANLMLEVPSFMASDPAQRAALMALHAKGNVLLLKGRPADELPLEVLPCFSYSIVALSEDRRLREGAVATPYTASRGIATVQSGIRTIAEMEASFVRGAVAVLGWPIDDLLAKSPVGAKSSGQADV